MSEADLKRRAEIAEAKAKELALVILDAADRAIDGRAVAERLYKSIGEAYPPEIESQAIIEARVFSRLFT